MAAPTRWAFALLIDQYGNFANTILAGEGLAAYQRDVAHGALCFAL